MMQTFVLEYWQDGDWYVGWLKGVPGVFSQGASLEELEENVVDAYRLMLEEESPPAGEIHTKQIEVEV